IWTGKRFFQVGGPTQVAMSGCQRGQAPGVAADEQKFRDQPVTVAKFQPAFRGNGQKIGHMLGRPHAAGGTVDDDANSNVTHVCLLHIALRPLIGKSSKSRTFIPPSRPRMSPCTGEKRMPVPSAS